MIGHPAITGPSTRWTRPCLFVFLAIVAVTMAQLHRLGPLARG